MIVKLFHPRTSDASYARVVAGVENQLQRLTQPGIAHVHRVGLAKQRLAIVRDDFGRFTLGQALTRLNTREVYLPPAVALSLVIELLEVLETAHAVGVVHGAITPGNVLLAEDGRVGVADFGALAALQASPSLRKAFAGKGRSSYRAPELGGSEPATIASDLYALGALAYELLTLREASTGHSALPTRNEKLPPPSRLVRSLSTRIDPVVMRALELDPTRRPRSCAEFAAALREYLFANGGMPEQADLRTFVDDLFPKDVVLGALGPVPFETFDIEDITGVLEIQAEFSEVAVRPPFSGGEIGHQPTDTEASAVSEASSMTWHAPEGKMPTESSAGSMRGSAASGTPVHRLRTLAPLPRPTDVEHEALQDTGPMLYEPEQPKATRRMFAFPFARWTKSGQNDDEPWPLPRWVGVLGVLTTLAGAAMITFFALVPPAPLTASPELECYETPTGRSVGFMSLSGAPLGSKVEIDGVRVCPETATTHLAVLPGARVVRIIHPKSGQVFEVSTQFESGKTQKVSAVFR